MDRYVPSRRADDRPPVYQFGRNEHPPLQSQRAPDSYRPDTFSFRVQSDRPVPRFTQHPPPPRSRPQQSGPRNDHRARPRGGRGGRPWQHRPATSDRPLLQGQHQRAPTPEQMLGMNEGEDRFKAVEDLSDSQEEEMDFGSDGQTDDVDSINERPQKRVHLSSEKNSDANAAPKWSNPDPYTALPPVDDSHGKRKDVVQLIRKAKASASSQKATQADGDDFISFGFGEASDANSSADEEPSDEPGSTENVSMGLKFSHLNNLHPDRTTHNAFKTLTASDLGPPPLPGNIRSALEIDVWPPPPKLQGSKRGFDEFLEDQHSAQVPAGKKKKGQELNGLVDVVPGWRVRPGRNATPWYTTDHSSTEHVGMRLHKEICDFYEFVRPREFERSVRQELVRRVQQFLSREFRSYGAEVDYFGSFAAGLYLPDADMDLVVRSREYRSGGLPQLGQTRRSLTRFAEVLRKDGLPKPGSVTCISGAKVPIVKYVDKITGLRVDISFENDTGIIANKTYRDWMLQFPAMPIIVSLIKQFLMMRGLNEVHTGGLGGFSTSCLVVHLMQMMPQLQSQNMNPMENLGEIFMEFLDFYGNRFNNTTTGIELNPPRYFQKHLNMRLGYNPQKAWKLSIVDPNRPDNDICGGTSNIRLILQCFADAFTTLRTNMSDIHLGKHSPSSSTSILSSLYAGEYHSFESQRARLKSLYTENSSSRPRAQISGHRVSEQRVTQPERAIDHAHPIVTTTNDVPVPRKVYGSRLPEPSTKDPMIRATEDRAYHNSARVGNDNARNNATPFVMDFTEASNPDTRVENALHIAHAKVRKETLFSQASYSGTEEDPVVIDAPPVPLSRSRVVTRSSSRAAESGIPRCIVTRSVSRAKTVRQEGASANMKLAHEEADPDGGSDIVRFRAREFTNSSSIAQGLPMDMVSYKASYLLFLFKAEHDRAVAFLQTYPEFPNVPALLTQEEFRTLKIQACGLPSAQADRSRAGTLRMQFPGASNIPDALNPTAFKILRATLKREHLAPV